MKAKILLTVFILNFLALGANAVNIGTYKAETEYGLIDGFKFNFFGRREGEKMIELKSETPEEIERLKHAKDQPKEEQDEHELFKFIHENTVAY